MSIETKVERSDRYKTRWSAFYKENGNWCRLSDKTDTRTCGWTSHFKTKKLANKAIENHLIWVANNKLCIAEVLERLGKNITVEKEEV